LYDSNPGRAWQSVHQRLGYNSPAYGNLIGRGWGGNSGRSWQGVHQRLGYNNPASGNLIGRGWRGSQQPSKLFKDNLLS